MKKLLALLCALSAALVMCACQEVPVDSKLAPSETTETTSEETTVTEDKSNSTSSNTSEISSETTEEETSETEATSEYTTEPVSVNEDSIKNLTYSKWNQANTNAKVQIAQRILTYIETQKGEVSMESSELIASLNALENANETDSLLSLSYQIIGIEE